MYLLVRSFGVAAAAAATVDDGDAQCLWSLTQEQIKTSSSSSSSSSAATAVVCSEQLSCRMTRPADRLLTRPCSRESLSPEARLPPSPRPLQKTPAETHVSQSRFPREREHAAFNVPVASGLWGNAVQWVGVALTEQRTCRQFWFLAEIQRESGLLQNDAECFEAHPPPRNWGQSRARNEPVLNVYRHALATAETDDATSAPGAPMILPVPSERAPSFLPSLPPFHFLLPLPYSRVTRSLCVHFRSPPQGRTCSCRQAGRTRRCSAASAVA